MDGRHARIVLGVADDARPADIRRAFRAHALRTHPDHGGDARDFGEVLAALGVLDRTDERAPREVASLSAPRRRFDAYDSAPRRAPRRDFADVLRGAVARVSAASPE